MNERFVLDTCHVSVEKVPTDEPLGVSVPSPVLEKCIVPKLHNVENHYYPMMTIALHQ